MTTRIAQAIYQHRPVNSLAAQIIHPMSNQTHHHQHGHHRTLFHSCLLFPDSTRRFGGSLEQAQPHQSHQAARPSFAPAHGVYGFHI
jgi:hypothetical protein